MLLVSGSHAGQTVCRLYIHYVWHTVWFVLSNTIYFTPVMLRTMIEAAWVGANFTRLFCFVLGILSEMCYHVCNSQTESHPACMYMNLQLCQYTLMQPFV